MPSEKTMPPGVWLYFFSLAAELTDADFQSFLAERGMNVPVENISVRSFSQGYSSAKVSFPNGVVARLVNWATDGNKLQGVPVTAMVRGSR